MHTGCCNVYRFHITRSRQANMCMDYGCLAIEHKKKHTHTRCIYFQNALIPFMAEWMAWCRWSSHKTWGILVNVHIMKLLETATCAEHSVCIISMCCTNTQCAHDDESFRLFVAGAQIDSVRWQCFNYHHFHKIEQEPESGRFCMINNGHSIF